MRLSESAQSAAQVLITRVFYLIIYLKKNKSCNIFLDFDFSEF